MKKSENQKFYFKFSYLENPTITYLDIIYRINEQYDVENIAFNNMKYRIKKQNDYTRLKEDRLKHIELSGGKLWKCSHEYKSNDKKDYMFRLFRTKKLNIV